MKCCVKCFNDENIKDYIVDYDCIGDCFYCGSINVLVIDLDLLGEYIRSCLKKGYENPYSTDIPYFLLSNYTRSIMDVLDQEENIFSNRLSWEIREQLVSDLLQESAPHFREITQGGIDDFEDENTELVLKDNFYRADGDFYIQTWEGFKEVVMHGNRFFDLSENQKRIELLSTFDEFFEEMIVKVNPGKILFRARKDIPTTLNELKIIENEIGPPPANFAMNMRMNPAGISYLYLAEDIETCKKEIKANYDETIGVGHFEIVSSLNLIDLSKVPNLKKSSIFSDDYNHDLNWANPFLKHFCEEVSKPIDKNYDLEYVPTQLLCEYIRFKGYDGIQYLSSLTGNNCYTLFCGQQKQSNLGDLSSSLIKNFKEWVNLVKFELYKNEETKPKIVIGQH